MSSHGAKQDAQEAGQVIDVGETDTVVDVENTEKPAKPTLPPSTWISGWRLVVIALSMALTLFTVQAESSITSTAIISITDSMSGFEKSSWVFTAYLVTYSGFPIFFSKLSDVYGRKQVMIGCLVMFATFSGACGGAQTIDQLIMFRWIQGIGAGGLIAVGTMYKFEMLPPEKWPRYSAFISSTLTLSVAIAPIIGAGMAGAGQWRWCFLINVPAGLLSIGLFYLAMPRKLRLEPAAKLAGSGSRIRMTHLRHIDFLGVILLLGASVLILAALQQAVERDSFNSPDVVVLLVLSPCLLACFLAWQWFIKRHFQNINPTLSWDLITNRVYMAMLGNALLSGMVLVVSVMQIPQRFIIVNSLSPIQAGLRLLPFASMVTFSSAVSAIFMSKGKIPVVPVLVLAALLEIAGVAGLSQTSIKPTITASQYGFQILAGTGYGICGIILLLLPPYIIDRKHLAVANGAVNQIRILGGSIGVAIVTCATSSSLRKSLLQILTPEQTAQVLDRTESILLLPTESQGPVREQFGKMYNTQMYILIGIAAAQALTSILQWQKTAVRIKG